jgi:hypothetical protein
LVASVAYTLLGSLAGSFFVERWLQQLVAQQHEQSLGIGAMLFNPFTLSAELEELRLEEADGTAILTVDNARLDFSIKSLLQQKIVLSEVLLQKPRLEVDISAPPHRGLAPLFATWSTMNQTASGAPGIRVDLASAHAGIVQLRDGAGQRAMRPNAPAPFEMTLSELGLQISHYQGGSVEPASLVLSMKIDKSATLSGNGRLAPVTGAVEISVQLVGLDLARFRPLFVSNFAFRRLSGVLGADGLLSHNADDTRFAGELAIKQLETGVVEQGRPLFSADEFIVHGADILLWPLRASARVLELNQPRFELTLAATGDPIGADDLSQWLLRAFAQNGKALAGDGPATPTWPPGIDTLAVSGGAVSITDPRFSTAERINLERVAVGTAAHVSEQTKTVAMQLAGTMSDSGRVKLSNLVKFTNGQDASGIAGEASAEVNLQRTDASLLAACFARFTGREIVSGTLQLDSRYRLEGLTLAMANVVSLKDLVLGRHSNPAPMHELPLDMAIALLTDPAGEIRFELPVTSRLADSAGSIPAAIETAVTGFVTDVTARPFSELANLVGFREAALNAVTFEPGSVAISEPAERQLNALGQALSMRPALSLRAIGGHARQSDRAALARGQVRLHVALAASTRPSGRPEQDVLDFSDPKVQAVLEEFVAARLAADELARLEVLRQLNGEISINANPAAYYEAVFEALAAQEPVEDNALRQLARYRAQSVIRKLLSMGIASSRLQLGNSIEAVDTPVALEVFAQVATAEP